jgi:hypothetical protein
MYCKKKEVTIKGWQDNGQWLRPPCGGQQPLDKACALSGATTIVSLLRRSLRTDVTAKLWSTALMRACALS